LPPGHALLTFRGESTFPIPILPRAMKLSLDRSLRMIWLLIGILLLLLLLAGGAMIVAQLVGNLGAGDDAVRVVSQAQPPREEARAVRYGEPHPIRGTATRLVQVEYGRAFSPDGGYASGGRYTRETVVNLIFVDAQGARLLLDRPAYVGSVSWPRPDEPARSWIVYQISLDDANRDGKLDARDPTSLYVSDLEGRNLRPVIRPPLRVKDYRMLDADRVLVYALEPPAGPAVAEERWRQRAFVYDAAAGRLSPYATLDSAATRAGQILSR
jgi:hypothetical protein